MEILLKTNNEVKGLRRGFSQLIGTAHPCFWKLINALKKKQILNELKIEQHVVGIQQQYLKRKGKVVSLPNWS